MLPRVSIYAAALVLAATATAPPFAAATRPGRLSTPARPPFDLGFSSLLQVVRGPIRVLATAVAEAPPPAPARRATRASRARRSSACTLEQLEGLSTSKSALLAGLQQNGCFKQTISSSNNHHNYSYTPLEAVDWLCLTSDVVPNALTIAETCAFYEVRLFKAFGDLGCDLNVGSLIKQVQPLIPAGTPIPAGVCVPTLPPSIGLDSCPSDPTPTREACTANAACQYVSLNDISVPSGLITAFTASNSGICKKDLSDGVYCTTKAGQFSNDTEGLEVCKLEPQTDAANLMCTAFKNDLVANDCWTALRTSLTQIVSNPIPFLSGVFTTIDTKFNAALGCAQTACNGSNAFPVPFPAGGGGDGPFAPIQPTKDDGGKKKTKSSTPLIVGIAVGVLVLAVILFFFTRSNTAPSNTAATAAAAAVDDDDALLAVDAGISAFNKQPPPQRSGAPIYEGDA